MNEEKLTHGQVAFLTYVSAVGNIVYTFTFVTSVAGRAFWVAVLIGVLANIPFAAWVLFLGRHLQGGTIFDLLETGLGKIISKLILLIYLVINLSNAVCMLNLFTGTIRVLFLQNTPSLFIMLFLVSVCTLFANGGLKSFARLAQILAILFTANYFMGFFLSFIKLFKMEYVTPIFDTTVPQFAKGVMITLGTNAECLLFLFLMIGSVPSAQKEYVPVIKGLVTWSVVLSFAILIMEGDIGHELLSRVAQAGITVARVIQINNYIRGLEILVLMTYQYITLLKTTIFIYSSFAASKKLFNVKKSRLPLFLSAALILFASAAVNSYNTGYYFSVFLGSYIILPFVVLVLILASTGVIIKKITKGGL